MKIAVVGTGYVGLPTGICFAHLGHEVVCIDTDKKKITALSKGKLTLYEEGLDELFKKYYNTKWLRFTTDIKATKDAELIILAVGTPSTKNGEVNLDFLFEAINGLPPPYGYTIIAVKSTVPVGTCDLLEKCLRESHQQAHFDVVSLPEFFREGFTLKDFFEPSRVIIGTNSARAQEALRQLYGAFIPEQKLLFTTRTSSEMIKYAANSFLAMKLSFINQIANLCEKVDADILEVAKGIGMDPRIGEQFLTPGPGYGGSCLPKDTLAFSLLGRKYNANLDLIDASIQANTMHTKAMSDKILKELVNIQKPVIAILGLAFKGGTDDCRQSPAIEIVKNLLKSGARIRAFDPKAMDSAKEFLAQRVEYASSAQEALQGADAVAILTEWQEFSALSLESFKTLMKGSFVFDLRNMLNKKRALELGLQYQGIGR